MRFPLFIFCVLIPLISAQFPNYFQSGSGGSFGSSGNWQTPSSGFSQYQPYRAPTLSQAPRISSLGQYQSSPQLSTLSQLSGYNRLTASAPQSIPWSQYQPSGNRGWSVPSPVRSYAGFTQPSSGGVAGYSRPTTLTAPVSAPAQFRGTPFESSFSISHQTPNPSAPQSYNSPSSLASPPAQTWSQPSPVSQWRPPTPQTYSAPAISQPSQSWASPSPVSQWRPPTPQTYSAPSPVASPPAQTWSPPVSQWRPAPTQTYSAPQAAPVAVPQPAAPATTYSSPQNSQNLKPAPVHYASIGQQLQGDYKFGYHTGDGGSFREETRLPDGTVQGAYGFIDADGKQRIVKYKAGKDGFQAEGDDVPKGTPAISGESGAPAPSQPASAPIKLDDGAAFRSFTQG